MPEKLSLSQGTPPQITAQTHNLSGIALTIRQPIRYYQQPKPLFFKTMVRASGKIIHRDHWNNHLIEIIDDGDKRSLYFSGNVLQSAMSLSSPHRLVLSYTHYMMATLLFNSAPKHVLIIGLGAGSLLRFINHHMPSCMISAIDYSGHIINLAKGYFHLPATPSTSIVCADGYEFLAGLSVEQAFDLILIDAFDDKGMSPSVYRSEFFELCMKQLHQDGLVSINVWSGDQKRMDTVKQDLSDHFSSIIELPVPKRGNVICLAGKPPGLLDTMEHDHVVLAQMSAHFGINFKQMVKICRKHNLGFRQRVTRLFS